MIRKLSVLCAAIALLATAPAHAQTKGTFLVDVGVGLPILPGYMGLDETPGLGLRLGYMMSNRIGIEADAFHYSMEPSSVSYTGVTVTEMPLHARLTWNAPMGNGLGFIFGLGFAYNKWGDDAGTYFNRDSSSVDTDSDMGPGALVGFRLGGGPLSVRLDLTADYIPGPIMIDNPWSENQVYWGADAMLSYGIGWNKAPKDSDKDGVTDKTDLCPNTSLGTAVDANGCPFGDADKDGVTDNLDKCPNTPAGATVNAEGCPADADADGVVDGIDKCPNTPKGATVNAEGCPADQDGDGVYNGLDKCPDTAAGAKVDANGCPVDTDGDGVPDYMDKCPNTPAGIKVNPEGCPILFEPGKTALVLQGVTFATNSATLDPTSTGILDRVANAVQYNPSGYKLEVAGYTDNTGSRAHNMRLSQARAESVMQYLVSKGVPASMMTAKGYGPDFPIDSNATAAGRGNNRRVELKQVQ